MKKAKESERVAKIPGTKPSKDVVYAVFVWMENMWVWQGVCPTKISARHRCKRFTGPTEIHKITLGGKP